MVFKLNIKPGTWVTFEPPMAAKMAVTGEEMSKIMEPQQVLIALTEAVEFQKKMNADARQFLSLYWHDHDAKSRTNALTLEPIEKWLDENKPLDRWFFIHLIEAAGAKALELGFSQYKSDIARAKNAKPKAWVLEAWKSRSDTGQSKAAFSRTYVSLVKKKFGLNVTSETITRDWLPKKKL